MRFVRIMMALAIAVLAATTAAVPASATTIEKAPDSPVVTMVKAPGATQYQTIQTKGLQPPCGTGCNGLSPYGYYWYWCGIGCPDNKTCADGVAGVDLWTQATREQNGGTVELRYNKHCRSAWARSFQPFDENNSYGLEWEFWIRNSNGVIYYTPSGVGNHYSKMVNDMNICSRAYIQYNYPGYENTVWTECY